MWGRGFLKKKGTTSIHFLGWKSVPGPCSYRTFWLQYSSESFKGMHLRIRDALNRYTCGRLHSNKTAVSPFSTQIKLWWELWNIVQTLWLDKENETSFPPSRLNLPHIQTEKEKKSMYNVEKEIYSHSLYNSGLYIIYFLNCKNQSKTWKNQGETTLLNKSGRKQNKVQNSSFPFVILTFRPSKKLQLQDGAQKIDGAQPSVHNDRNQSSHLFN